MAATVTWHSLTLEGFGRYRGKVRIEFHEGLNIVVADNEAGKSTLVAGLSAVIFGLPNASSRDSFGTARFLNWEGPENFTGQVEFTAAGRRYRMVRQFEGNRVVLDASRETEPMSDAARESTRPSAGKGWETLVRGEHNPGAHKPNETYEQLLGELLGVRSRELFERTFCVGQPLPEGHELDRGVRELVVGAGGSVEGAMELLFTKLRAITRRNTEFGAGTRDANKDQPLDAARRKIEDLERTIVEDAQSLDRLHGEQAALREDEDERQRCADQLREKRATVAAWSEWRAARAAYEGAHRQQSTIEEALDKVRERRGKIDDLARDTRVRFAPFEDQPAGTGNRLRALPATEARMGEHDREVAALEGPLGQAEERVATLESRLAREFAAVRGRPDLPSKVLALQRLLRERADIRERLLAAQVAETEAAAGLGGMRRWDRLGGAPSEAIRTLRKQAAAILAGWRKLADLRSRAEGVRDRLTTGYSLFEQADPVALRLLAGYDLTREKLEREAATAEAEATRFKVEAARRRRGQLAMDEEFGDISGLGDEFVRAATAKIRLLDECHRLEDSARRTERDGRARMAGVGARAQAGTMSGAGGSRRLAWRAVLALTAAGGAAAATWSFVGAGGGRAWAIAAVAALAAGLGAWIVAGRLAGRGLVGGSGRTLIPERAAPSEVLRRLAAIRDEMALLDPALAAYATAEPALLSETLTRVARRDGRRTALTETAAAADEETIPADETAVAAGEATAIRRLARAQSALASFREATASFCLSHPDPGKAYLEWQELRAEFARLRAQGEEIAEAYCGGEAGATIPPGEPYETLRELADITGTPPQTIGGFMAWIERMDQTWWDEVTRQAGEYEKAAAALRDARSRMEALTGADQAGRTDEDRKSMEIETLAADIAPFGPDEDAERLAAHVKACRETEHLKIQAAAEAAQLRERLSTAREGRERLAAALAAERARLAGPLAIAGGDTGRTITLWADFEASVGLRRTLESEVAGLLGGQSADGEESLRRRATDAANRAAIALSTWTELARSNPGLPPADLEYDHEELGRRQRELDAEIARLEQEWEAVEDRVRALARQVAALEAKDLVNVAQQRERLEEERTQAAEMDLDARALGVAWAELEAARRDYQATYRGFLADKVTARFAELSGVEGREVVLDEDFCVSLRVPSGECSVAQLSQGARDQLYLALRLAVADLLARDVQLPFIFDDPFLTFDRRRLARIRQTLEEMAPRRQIILLSHREELAGWGRRVAPRESPEARHATEGDA